MGRSYSSWHFQRGKIEISRWKLRIFNILPVAARYTFPYPLFCIWYYIAKGGILISEANVTTLEMVWFFLCKPRNVLFCKPLQCRWKNENETKLSIFHLVLKYIKMRDRQWNKNGNKTREEPRSKAWSKSKHGSLITHASH